MATDRQPADLQAHLGYWLRMVSNAVSFSFARKVEGKGVTVAEWVFLRALYDAERMSPSVLAEHINMSKGAVSKLADRLIPKALVERKANPADKRAHSLALTPAGRRLVPRLAKLADENDESFFGPLSPRERTQLMRLLRKIVSARSLNIVPTD